MSTAIYSYSYHFKGDVLPSDYVQIEHLHEFCHKKKGLYMVMLCSFSATLLSLCRHSGTFEQFW